MCVGKKMEQLVNGQFVELNGVFVYNGQMYVKFEEYAKLWDENKQLLERVKHDN